MSTSKSFLAKALIGLAVLTSVGLVSVAPTRADSDDYARNNHWRHEQSEEWRQHEWREHNHWRWGYYGYYRPYSYGGYSYYSPYDRSYYYEH